MVLTLELEEIPIKNFVYTSFQELATYVSHNRVAQMAKKYGDNKLSKMCKMIAGDEMRHHHAYSEFVSAIFKVDPSEMMIAFQYMMKQNCNASAFSERIRRKNKHCIRTVF
jgi:acyl-[acyl-carrier-protein] desaturase